MAWSRAEIELLAKQMAAKPAGFRVSARTAPLVIEALAYFAREGMADRALGYRVDLWTADQASILEAVATANHLNVGRAAYLAAVETWPSQPLTLRKAAWILEASKQRS